MRKLIFGINTTLDGCVDHTRQYADEETHKYWTNLIREADLLVYGRKTYQLMVPFWPEVAKSQSMSAALNEFARAFDSVNRVVFSRSLHSADDSKTRFVRADLHDEILKLKQQPGGNILVGGVDIPSQLMELGLVDEYRFVVAPIIAGDGRRLFDNAKLPESLRLRFVESKSFQSGSIALHYSRS